MKNKCWTKEGKNLWYSSEEMKSVEVWKSSKTKKWNVSLIPQNKRDVRLRSSLSKIQAMKVAKKYMEKNNTC